ncbi:hypothetical protein Taro_056784, partial [Colocasia esculenta]|nr:hypothetical protein [Colocasia esculenta]
MEDAMAAETPQQLTAVQRLQLLINELEEYEVSEPSNKPTLDQYIPWEEIERKRRLRNWLLQVQHEALQEGDLPPSPNLSLFNGDEEITMEQLDSMFSSFHCYMVFIPPPKELQTPTSNTTAQVGDKPTTLVYQRRPPGSSSRHPKKGRGRHQKAASSTTKHPDRIILFHGEETKPLPEPQIRTDSYIFDPSDEEGGLSDKVPQSGDKNLSPYASSNEPDNVPPLPNEKLLAPISQKKPVKSKELSGTSSRESSHLDQIRFEADDKILQQLQSLPVNITVWEAIAWSKDLRETLVKILQEPEIYEAHMTNFQAQAYEALAANITFTDEDLLLSSPYHNRPLYMKGKINNMQLNRILICSLKQEQSVRRLKTFVVTYQRKERRKNARKAAKPILFYKGELILQNYTGDDFGWEDTSNNQLESIQEMADMPEKIKEMCKKHKIPQSMLSDH